MLIYSAGAMTAYFRVGRFEEAEKWRIELKNKLKDLNIRIYDPTVNFFDNIEYNNKTIVHQNRYYLDKSDLVVVNLENILRSPGTLYEIYRADFLEIPVIAFGNEANQPHIENSITQRFDTLDEVVEYIKILYLQ